MLFNLLTSLIDQYSFLNVFKYLTFRTGLSVVTSLIVVFLIAEELYHIHVLSVHSWKIVFIISNSVKSLKSFILCSN